MPSEGFTMMFFPFYNLLSWDKKLFEWIYEEKVALLESFQII